MTARAWGWVRHLRAGGTTPWAQWPEGPEGDAEPAGRVIPGAQQLELLRRLNLAGRPGPALVERVLEASAPGRGRPDLLLAGAVEPSAFGPRPVDPDELPAEEPLRVAVGGLAEAVHAAGLPAPAPDAVVRPWRRRYRLVGDPALADPIRAQLIARGRPPGGPLPRVLVIGTALDRMLADVYVTRCFETAMASWPEWLATLLARRAIAPRVDLVRVAARWSGIEGAERVRIVTDLRAVPRLVGVRHGLQPPRVPSALETEVARRVAGILGLLTTPAHRQRLLDERLRPMLAAHVPDGAPYSLPAEHLDWVAERAARMRLGLQRAGYPVVGDLADLLPRARQGGGGPTDEDTLDLAVRLLLAPVGGGR